MREDLKFLIVGDTIIDEDIFLIASGISLETPTMKTVYDTNRVKYGGAIIMLQDVWQIMI